MLSCGRGFFWALFPPTAEGGSRSAPRGTAGDADGDHDDHDDIDALLPRVDPGSDDERGWHSLRGSSSSRHPRLEQSTGVSPHAGSRENELD